MARRRKVPLVKGPKRIIYDDDGPEVVQSLICGECEKLTQSVTIQFGEDKARREKISRTLIVARACANSESHKDKMKYLWPVDDWIIPIFEDV